MRARTGRQLGAAIRGRRNDRGWTQGQLAAKAGVSRQWVVQLEQGKPTVQLDAVLRCIAVLGGELDVVDASSTAVLDDLLGLDDG